MDLSERLTSERPFDGFACQVNMLGSDPPSVVFEHCVVGGMTRPTKKEETRGKP